jgi:alpha/beta superfamily hydrolase
MYPAGNLFIPASHGKLEAIIKAPGDTQKGVALVCHPHPLGGGTMHNKVVFRTAAGLVDAGLVTMRFNFRGVGLSTGKHDGSAEKQDVRDSLDFLSANFPDEPITFAGFSFGTRIGSEVAINDERIIRMISIGTPVDKYLDFDFLTQVRKPILFVHGDSDEYGSVEKLKALVGEVSKNAPTKLIVFENCGHFFDNHLNALREAIRDWTQKQIASAESTN